MINVMIMLNYKKKYYVISVCLFKKWCLNLPLIAFAVLEKIKI